MKQNDIMKTHQNKLKTGILLFIGILCGSLLFNLLTSTPPACIKNIRRVFEVSKQRSNEQKSKIFLGIILKNDITDKDKSIAAASTWMRRGEWSVNIFAGQKYNHISTRNSFAQIVRLPDSHDFATTMHKKYFLTLRFMYDNYFDDFDWFILTNEDVYIDSERLEKLLNSYNSSEEILLGRSDTRNGCSFVSSVPGLVLSKGLLTSLRPRLKTCIHHLHTGSVDEEIGRCVWEHTDAIVANSPHIDAFFYKQDLPKFLFQQFDEKALSEAVLVAGISNGVTYYQLHKKFLKFKMKLKMEKIVNLRHEIENSELLAVQIKNTSLSEKKYPILFTRFNDLTCPVIDPLSGATPWISFTRFFRYQSDGLSRAHSKAEKNFINDLISSIDDKVHKHCGNILTKLFKYGYLHKSNPSGVQVVVAYQTSGTKHCALMAERSYSSPIFMEDKRNVLNLELVKLFKMSSSLRTQPISIFNSQNQFANALQSHQNMTNIYIIVPIQGRFTSLENFMKNYEKNFLKTTQTFWKLFLEVHLVVVFMGSYADSDSLAMNRAGIHLLADYQVKYHNSHITYHNTDIGERDFSRGAGLQVGSLEANPNDIIFFMDVDMIVPPDVIKECHKNAIQGKYAWYPISFSQYDPNHICPVMNTVKEKSSMTEMFGISKSQFADDSLLSEENGFWRDFGFGLACMYKSDFIATGGFDLMIEGWGEEDIRLYLSLIKSGINIVRSKQKDLIHIFHHKFCSLDLNEVQLKACLRTKASHFASQKCLTNRLNALKIN